MLLLQKNQKKLKFIPCDFLFEAAIYAEFSLSYCDLLAESAIHQQKLKNVKISHATF